jgi:hypothetical protein
MQIIVAKTTRYGRRRPPSLALCEVVRQTDKRYFVTFVRGERWALQGRGDKLYTDAADVISFDAAQFDAMAAAVTAYEARQEWLDKLEQEAWEEMEGILKPVKRV